MEPSRFEELIPICRDGLLEDVLPFWIEHGIDREYGGIMTSLDRDGTVVDTDKGLWQQCRFAWLLGELVNNVERRQEWLALARQILDFVTRYGFDESDGRMWFHLTRDGRPIRKRRYAFSESFAAIAYGELARATGDDEAAAMARRCFRGFVEQWSVPGKMPPKFTDTRPSIGLGFPMITINTAQQLRGSIGFEDADVWIDRSIDTLAKHFLKPELRCVMETVAPDGSIIDHFDGRTLNPGHAIEGAWFILMEGRHREDEMLVAMGCAMLDWMWERGWDAEYGGLYYYRDVYHRPVSEYWHDMKFWWPHNEAVIATLLAYHLTGDSKYLDWHRQVHDWAYRHFADPEYGEWYGYLNRAGEPTSPLKGNIWKGPFHLPRMQLVCWGILEEMANGEDANG